MLRVPCPKCQKSSYTSNVETFNQCSHCGFVFSGKYGVDNRCEPRLAREIPFVLSYQGQDFAASTSDFSQRGVGIKLFGEAPITVGEVLKLTIGDLHVVAKVMWVKKLPDKSLAGLQRVN